MRVKLVHHGSEWLDGEHEPPEGLAGKTHLTAWRAERSSDGTLTAMKINRGTGVWDESGRLVHHVKLGADLRWARGSTELLSLEARFGPCQQHEGVRHALRRLDAETFDVKDEIDVCVDTGSVRLLILSSSEDRCVATWLDQNRWGYVVIDLVAMKQLPGTFSFRPGSLSPPGFSPDDSVVVSCRYHKSGWWTDEVDDFWDHPSPGGLRKVGVISVHDLASDVVSDHEVLVDLPEGWIPVDPDSSDWDSIWGPEFVSESEFRMWLPDGSSETLRLPLPARIEIRRELGTERRGG